MTTLTHSSTQTISTPSKSANKYFYAMDGFRIFAVCLIVVLHSRNLLGFRFNESLVALYDPVAYFFILSGFVLTHHYKFDTTRQFLRYLGARIARIYPCYIAAVTLFLCLNPKICSSAFFLSKAFWANLFLLQSWYFDPTYSIGFVGPAWTLSVECFLYLTLPALLIFSKRKWSLLVGAFAFCIVTSFISYRMQPECVDWCLAVFPPARVLDFALGVVIYRKMKETDCTLSPLKASCFDFLFVAVFLLRAFNFPELLAAKLHLSIFLNVFCTKHCMTLLTFAPLVASLASGNGIISRLFAWRPLVAFSAISCSLYLIHAPLIIFWLGIVNRAENFHPYLLLGVLATIVFSAVALFVFVEDPARKWMNATVNESLGYLSGRAQIKPTRRALTVAFASLSLAAALGTGLMKPIVKAGEPTWLSETTAQSMFVHSAAEPREVTFENRVTLVSLKSETKSDKIVLETLWRSTPRTDACRFVVHLIDDRDQIVEQYSKQLVPCAEDSGLLWSNEVDIPKSALKRVKKLGLVILVGDKSLIADKGQGDWGMHRLLIDVPDH